MQNFVRNVRSVLAVILIPRGSVSDPEHRTNYFACDTMNRREVITVPRVIWCLVAILTLVSCATQERVPLGNFDFGKQESKVILIPMEGWNTAEVDEIAGAIEKRHQLHVMTYTTMGKNAKMFNAEKQQFLSEEIAQTAWQVLQQNGDANHESDNRSHQR